MAIVELWLSKLLDFRAGEKNCQNSTPSLSPGDHDYGRLVFQFVIVQKLMAENRLNKLASGTYCDYGNVLLLVLVSYNSGRKSYCDNVMLVQYVTMIT